MRRTPALGFGLAMGLSVVPCVVGCTSTNGDAADGAVVDANARGDAPLEAPASSACLAAGGHCVADGTGCNSDLGLEDCGSQASCCYDLCSADAAVTLQASNYDQSCTVDTDCYAAGFGNPCAACINCPNGAINKAAEPQYLADLKQAVSGKHVPICGCFDFSGELCCSGGTCHLNSDFQCMDALSARDAATDAIPEAAADAKAEASADTGTE